MTTRSSGKNYETFVRTLDDIEEGKEKEIEIRSTEDYRIKVVKAQLYGSDKEMPGTETLWIRALVGHLLDQKPWHIKINKIIEER